MEVRSKFLAIVVCFGLITISFANSVSWIGGLSSPAKWSITPNHPGDTDVISFSGPTAILGSSCYARMFYGGTETITVDCSNKVVELSFDGPVPDCCGTAVEPVCGLKGNFGPLEAGNWVFRCTEHLLSFEISFTVCPTDEPDHVTSDVSPHTYYVDKDAPGPINNGDSWNRAFINIQDALCITVSGDTILVAEGTYKPDRGSSVLAGDRLASFVLIDGVKLFGGYAGYGHVNPDARDIEKWSTVLSGDLNGDDLWDILNRDDNSYHVVIANSGTARLDGFVITSGQATGPENYEAGGGVYIKYANTLLVNCHITGNTACFGGGISSKEGGTPSLVNCKITGNDAQILGGGICCYSGTMNLTNSLIAGNISSQASYLGGSAIFNLGGSLAISDCTIMDNLAPNGMAVSSITWPLPATNYLNINNSILYDGGDEIFTNHPGTVTVSFCDIQGGWTGNGTANISAKPLITLAGAWSIKGQYIMGDYHLDPNSPCINKGRNSLLPADIGDLDSDGNTAEKLPVDLDGMDRILDSTVDMGAYEQEAIITVEPPVQESFDSGIVYYVQNDTSGWLPVTLTSSSTFTLTINFQGKLSLSITPASAAGGNWSAWFDPEPGLVGPGTVNATIKIRGENVDLSKLSPGLHKLANLHIYLKPVL